MEVASDRPVDDRWWTARGVGRQEVALGAVRIAVLVSVLVGIPHLPEASAGRFVEIVHASGAPYRDVPIEYPIGELVVIRAVGWADLTVARVLLALVAFAADAIAYSAVAVGWGRAAARRYLWLGTTLLILLYRRPDVVGVALAVVGVVLATRRGRERAGGLAFGAAVLVKLWPVIVAPALAIERRRRALVVAAITVASGFVAWVLIGGVGGITQVLTYRGATGWEVESTVGTLVWAFTGRSGFEQGAFRTGEMGAWPRAVLLIILIATLVAIWERARRRTSDPAGAPALAAIAALLACSPLLSPQYLIWFLPWAAVAGGDGRRWSWLAATSCLLTGGIMTLSLAGAPIGNGAYQLLLTLRNASLIAIPVVWLWRRTPVPAQSSTM
jgi:glycosyl transferase family 87